MTCPGCGASYTASNQHTACPSCGKVVGTPAERDLEEQLRQVIKWFEDWETATSAARKESERDRDYYDGMQWTDQERNDLMARGQAAIVKNRIFKKINFLKGSEVRDRADPRALPRTPAHDEDVEAVTDAERYVCDAEDFDATSSVTWGHELIEGYGGAVVEHETIDDSVEVRIRQVPWDRLWYDLHSRKPDFADARHKGISTWWDLDDAVAFYADRKDTSANFEEVLEQALTHASVSDQTHEDKPRWANIEDGRQRIRVSECYYKKGRDWWVCHYTRAGFVVPPKPTGYLDEKGRNVCPLEMVAAFVTREGMRYGLVRHMIGPQDEINKRSSKAIHWLSVDRMIHEEGAVLDPDGAKTERAKPDGDVVVQRNALFEKRIQFEKGMDMAQGQIAMLEQAKAEIDTIGPEIPQLSAASSSESGRAIMARQQIGSLELAPLIDNHKRWKRAIYRQIWYRIRQFWPEEKWLRVRDDSQRTGFRFVGLNRKTTRGQRFMELLKKGVPFESAAQAVLGDEAPVVLNQVAELHQQMPQAQNLPPEAQQQHMAQMLMRHPKMAEPMTAADVAQLDVDIVLDESPDTAILQIEEYEAFQQQLPAFLQADPQNARMYLEMSLELSQHRFKKRVLDMLRKPADPQAMQMQQMMQQMQMAGAQAGVEKTQSETQLNQARAAQAAADASVKQPTAAADIQAKQAAAMHDAATAGMRAGGGAGSSP